MSSNVFQRILIATIAIPAIILITWFGQWLFLVFVIAIVVLSQWEFYDICRRKNIENHTIVGILSGLVTAIWFYYVGDGYTTSLTTAIVVSVGLVELAHFRPENGLQRYAYTVLGVFYVSWLMSHAVLLRELPTDVGMTYAVGAGFIFLAFIPTWVGDTAAYFFGSFFGRHKFSPLISPKKSVEGSIAGMLGAVGTVVLLKYWYADYLTLWHAILLGLALGVVAQLGDLIESLAKRDVGVKDSSGLLPGHGGLLDRFDASFFTIPTTYYFLKYITFSIFMSNP